MTEFYHDLEGSHAKIITCASGSARLVIRDATGKITFSWNYKSRRNAIIGMNRRSKSWSRR